MNNEQPIKVTDLAAKMIKQAIKDDDLENHGLRIGIMGMGCSGPQYHLGLHDLSDKRDYDTVFDQNGVSIVIDDTSLKYIKGSTIDYIMELHESGFKVINPNSASACGGCSVEGC